MLKQNGVALRDELGSPCNVRKTDGTDPEKFAAHVAHELGNPLDGVRRYVRLALGQSIGEPLIREYLLKADSGILKITRILHALLVYSKQCHENQGKIVEVHSLLKESLAEFECGEKYPGISIHRIFSVEGPLYVEARGIPIVLQNLFKNGIQAMNGCGVLTIATWRQNGSVGIAVQDTGSGVPESIRARIFDPFFSTKEPGEGTGIGLALSREIVERNEGDLRCENVFAPAKGARFTIILPRKSVQQNSAEDYAMQI